MAGLRSPGRVASGAGGAGGSAVGAGRGGRVTGGRARAGGRVGALGARIPQGVTGSLSLVGDAAGSLIGWDNEATSGADKERRQNEGSVRVNTRTIAIIALIIAVIVVLLLVL
jgi:hypothetical protein